MIDTSPAPIAQRFARPLLAAMSSRSSLPVPASADGLRRWHAALAAADLCCLSRRPGALSLLAPTDAAFETLLQELDLGWQDLCADRPRLRRVLLAHVLPQRLDGRALRQPGLRLSTLGGNLLQVESDQRLSDGQGCFAQLLHSAQPQAEGLAFVHQIDRVLLPPQRSLLEQLERQPELSEFLAALRHSGLDSLLQGQGPMTLFVPCNAGFAQLAARLGMRRQTLWQQPELLRQVLLQHLVPGAWPGHELPWGTSLHSAEGSALSLGALGLLGDGEQAQPLHPGQELHASNGLIHRIAHALLPKLPMRRDSDSPLFSLHPCH